MRANVDVQDCVMRVLQSCSRLRDMPVPGAVCQPRAPYSRGKDTIQGEHVGENERGGGEAQAVAGKPERGRVKTNDASASGDKGSGERQGQVGREQGDRDATGGLRGDGGRRARILTHPGGPTSPVGLQRLGSCQSWHVSGRRLPRRIGVAGVVA